MPELGTLDVEARAPSAPVVDDLAREPWETEEGCQALL